jgi:hypothetical protein
VERSRPHLPSRECGPAIWPYSDKLKAIETVLKEWAIRNSTQVSSARIDIQAFDSGTLSRWPCQPRGAAQGVPVTNVM